MNDFTILHLSDLHINGTGKGLTPLLKNLLSDIKEELKPVDNVILVITGDIIEMCIRDRFLDRLVTGETPEGINVQIVFFIQLFNVICSYLFFAYKTSVISAYPVSYTHLNKREYL